MVVAISLLSVTLEQLKQWSGSGVRVRSQESGLQAAQEKERKKEMPLLAVMPACNNSRSIPTRVVKAYWKKEDKKAVPEKQKKQVKIFRSLAPPLMVALMALSPLFNPPGKHHNSSIALSLSFSVSVCLFCIFVLV
ncbi:uncharacterized protein LOC122068262 [Macadamia integrifolia]|uniref:uncharacterized protein LOC122068262 n=1 Tax=Macadamia integrifolia TaxID=60698 RepID=UPI001C4F66F4|nr:uncharacterized protein LOC122068262 [Macadamia integrifolia]